MNDEPEHGINSHPTVRQGLNSCRRRDRAKDFRVPGQRRRILRLIQPPSNNPTRLQGRSRRQLSLEGARREIRTLPTFRGLEGHLGVLGCSYRGITQPISTLRACPRRRGESLTWLKGRVLPSRVQISLITADRGGEGQVELPNAPELQPANCASR